jgi:hypothetical protein
MIDRLQVFRREVAIRGHDLSAPRVGCLDRSITHFPSRLLQGVDASIWRARTKRKPVIAFLGGHPIKLGLQRFLIDLIERGSLTHIATNGSGLIHDFELAALGGTSENVAKWIQAGQFGLWTETGSLNDIIREGAQRDEGFGEAIGRTIEEERLPHRDLSIAAAGYRCGVPVTCHVTIGADIIHAHPNCDGAALGQTSYTDFLIFARAVQDLEGGVFLNIGSAVTGPEVFLKALSMARNIAHQEGKQIRHFTTAVFDLVDLPENWRDGPPSKDEALYYYRPWKTLLCRTVADGGQSYYIRGDHRDTIPALWQALVKPAGSPADSAPPNRSPATNQ